MKILGLMALLLVVGCAPVKSLEDLENEAMLTGDWSEVEKRERMIALKEERQGKNSHCPVGYIKFCQTLTGTERCGCVDRRSMADVFAGR